MKSNGYIRMIGNIMIMVIVKDIYVWYYELEQNEARGGITYYDSEILNLIQEFCDKHIVYY